jgi:hypothetical protein
LLRFLALARDDNQEWSHSARLNRSLKKPVVGFVLYQGTALAGP